MNQPLDNFFQLVTILSPPMAALLPWCEDERLVMCFSAREYFAAASFAETVNVSHCESMTLMAWP
jgi:hypothetical protein